MKARMTMAAIFLAAVMIAAAVIPAATGGTGNTGTTENYIIGTSAKTVEVAGGVNAQIEFNRTAFSANATVDIYVAQKSDSISWGNPVSFETQTSSPGVATVESITGVNIKITATDAAEGVYAVAITGTSVFENSTILFKVKITDEWNLKEIPAQEYVWAAHVKCSQVVEENGYEIVIDNQPQNWAFQYEESYSMKLSVKKTNDTSTDSSTSPFEFFAIGLPKGLSVTSDKTIGGKLATDTPQSEGTFTVYAVLGGVAYSKSITYTIGEGPSEFSYTTDKTGADIKDPEYVIIETGKTITITTTMDKPWENNITYIDAIIKGNKPENSTKTLTVDPSNTKKATITLTDSDFGLGSCRIDITYHYQITYMVLNDSGETETKTVNKTETKTMQIFVVGDIHHADLDPAVTTTP